MTDISLADRSRASAWAAGAPGLAQAVADWESEIGGARSALSELAVTYARPGAASGARALRHLTAISVSRALRLTTRLPSDLRDLTPLRDPQGWARAAGVEAFVDQLALGGPGTAEIARLITGAGRLFPGDLVDELRRRALRPPIVEADAVTRVAQRVFGDIVAVGPAPLAALPVTQLHQATLRDGSSVAVRVRRPGVARQLLADSRLSANLVTPLQQLLPQVGGLHPIGFVQLTTRQILETIDLRFEALNAVEMGLVAEAMGLDGIELARPLAHRSDERVLLTELLHGTPLLRAPEPDASAVVAAITALTIESALVHGVFWADPSADHIVVLDDGRIGIVGLGNVGRLTPQLRHAGVLFLKSILAGEAEGQVRAMRLAGAVPPDADVEGLLEDIAGAEALQVANIMTGGEAGLLGGLNEAVRLLLQHRLRPPLEVILLLRTVFALGELADRLVPDGGGLMTALLPLFGRLPELIAAAEASAESDTLSPGDAG